jgi:DtxR family Mn-dependent transcriptional regulator
MEPSKREDYLEAIYLLIQNNRCNPTTDEIESVLKRPHDEVAADLQILSDDGDLTLDDHGTAALTQQGEEVGMRVVKKHHVLQCFFTEMLGVEPDAASREACVIEHGISDDIIHRLGKYLDTSAQYRWRRGRPGEREVCEGHPLLDFEEDDDVKITLIARGGSVKRLMDLGLLPGETVKIKRKLGNAALVVLVRGTEIALSQEIAVSVCGEKVA